jgi:hypothetical protein
MTATDHNSRATNPRQNRQTTSKDTEGAAPAQPLPTAPPQAAARTRALHRGATPGGADAAHRRGAAPGRADTAHHRGAAPGGADAVRNPLLSDMAAAGSCSGVWILGFHWRSRVSWGPTCGPSHIDRLLEEAVSGASRPAFIPWAGTTCAGPTGARYCTCPHPKVFKEPGTRAPWVRPTTPPAAPSGHRGRPTWGATASPHAQGPRSLANWYAM